MRDERGGMRMEGQVNRVIGQRYPFAFRSFLISCGWDACMHREKILPHLLVYLGGKEDRNTVSALFHICFYFCFFCFYSFIWGITLYTFIRLFILECDTRSTLFLLQGFQLRNVHSNYRKVYEPVPIILHTLLCLWKPYNKNKNEKPDKRCRA